MTVNTGLLCGAEDLAVLSREDVKHARLQPIVNLTENRAVGYELLAGADVCPAWDAQSWRRFYSQAQHVLLERLPQNALAFINIDPWQALDPAIVSALMEFDPALRARCAIEWTEAACEPMSMAEIVRAYQRLRDAGFGLAVDDVGNGTDGIGRTLRALPEWVKFDRSLLVRGRAMGDAGANFLTSLRAMFEGLGAAVVLEGVETQADIEFAKRAGLRFAQGFHFQGPFSQLAQIVSHESIEE
jgi:EAL domain-containing protein (putative c-di-GMP-specific phosphodiesterase class I)